MKKGVSRPSLIDEEKNLIAQWCLLHSKDKKLLHGAKKEAAILFNVDVRTIYRIWKTAESQRSLGKAVSVISKRKECIHGDRHHLDEEKMSNLSLLERTSMSQLATNLGISTTQVHRLVKKKEIRSHTSAIKPFLTDANKLARLKWSISMLNCIRANGKIAFQSMFNIIHIDEKWFNMTMTSQRYYMLPDETNPHRTCKSKAHVEKIMFLAAVSRPITDCNGDVIFYGKFGIFPFIYTEPAKRNSKNRRKGTMITKAVQSITKAVMKECFIEWLVPIIQQKWPEGASKNIFIQQDNAKPHINNNDPDWQAAAQSNGFNIQLICQPANSPDTNVNDLGFFRSIQTLKDRKNSRTVDDLVKNVKETFEEYPPDKLNDVFLTLQASYGEIIKMQGCNNYKTPHTAKERLRREGLLPDNIEVEEQVVDAAMEYLNMQLHEEGQAGPFRLEDLVHGIQQVNIEE